MDRPRWPDIAEEHSVTAVLEEARKKWDRIDDAYYGLQCMLIRDFDSGRPISTQIRDLRLSSSEALRPKLETRPCSSRSVSEMAHIRSSSFAFKSSFPMTGSSPGQFARNPHREIILAFLPATAGPGQA